MISRKNIFISLIMLYILKISVQTITDYESISGNGYKISSDPKGQKVYRYSKGGNGYDYSQIIKYYGILEILNSEEKIIKTLDRESEEEDFLFKFNEPFYYLIYNEPTPFDKCGFQYLNSKTELTNILTSSLNLYLLKEREFEIKVLNEQIEERFISIWSIFLSPVREWEESSLFSSVNFR